MQYNKYNNLVMCSKNIEMIIFYKLLIFILKNLINYFDNMVNFGFIYNIIHIRS